MNDLSISPKKMKSSSAIFSAIFSAIILTACGGEPSPTVPIATLPGSPSNPNASAGNGQATVTFTAPTNDGGSAITGYTVISNPVGGIDSNAGSQALSHLVTGLSNGKSYSFTVTASNAAGVSLPSNASNSVIPAQVGINKIGIFQQGDSVTYFESDTTSGSGGTATVSGNASTLYEQIGVDGTCNLKKTFSGVGLAFPDRIGCSAQEWPVFPSGPLTVGQALPPLAAQVLPNLPASCSVSNEEPQIAFSGSILAVNEAKLTPAGVFNTVKYAFSVSQTYTLAVGASCQSSYVCWREPILNLTVACDVVHDGHAGHALISRVLTGLSLAGK